MQYSHLNRSGTIPPWWCDKLPPLARISSLAAILKKRELHYSLNSSWVKQVGHCPPHLPFHSTTQVKIYIHFIMSSKVSKIAACHPHFKVDTLVSCSLSWMQTKEMDTLSQVAQWRLPISQLETSTYNASHQRHFSGTTYCQTVGQGLVVGPVGQAELCCQSALNKLICKMIHGN